MLRSVSSVNESWMNESGMRILYFIPNLGHCILPHDNGLGELRNACRKLATMKTCSCSRAFNRVATVLRCHVTATHGWSGHARFNVPDVPGLRDRSAIIGDLDKLDSAVVIYLSDPHGIQVCHACALRQLWLLPRLLHCTYVESA